MIFAAGAQMSGGESFLDGRQVQGVVGTKVRFRPQLFYQEVLPQHVATADLHFHAALDTGKTYARVPTDREYAADGALARAAARAVSERDAAGEDQRVLSRALREAATWRDVRALQHLLSSTYCTVAALEEALCEAAAQGHTEHVLLLLDAGAVARAQPAGKSALHLACEQGAEDCAHALLSAEPQLLQLRADVGGLTPLEVARANDLGGMARRLAEAFGTQSLHG